MAEKRLIKVEMGERLKKIRKKHHMTQQELAEFLFVSVDSVSGYENGRITIGHDYIQKLCARFNVSADYFYFGYEKELGGEIMNKQWTELFGCLTDEERERALQMLRLAFVRNGSSYNASGKLK